MNKTYFLISLGFVLLLAIIFGTLMAIRLGNLQKIAISPTPIPLPTSIPTPSAKNIESSGVIIDNPYKNSKDLTKQGDVLMESNDRYRILYLKQFDEFLISVNAEPFEIVRQEAEGAFLQRLNISKIDACKLKVRISPPIKKEELAPSYKLSFCNQ